MKSQRIKREIKHLCKRLISIATVRRRQHPVERSESSSGGRCLSIFKSIGQTATTGASSPSKARPRISSGASALLARVVLTLPLGAGRREAAAGGGFLFYIFDEKIFERGSRRDEDGSGELHPQRRMNRFLKTRPDDGSSPILNLARDDLEHQPQFC